MLSATPSANIFYNTQIKTLIQVNCEKCHQEDKPNQPDLRSYDKLKANNFELAKSIVSQVVDLQVMPPVVGPNAAMISQFKDWQLGGYRLNTGDPIPSETPTPSPTPTASESPTPSESPTATATPTIIPATASPTSAPALPEDCTP
jgi:hypothetical protein